MKAWQRLSACEYEQGVRECQQLNATFPDFAEGWHVSSHMAQAVKKHGKALEFIDRALELDSDNAVFLAQKASLLRIGGRLVEAHAIATSIAGARMESASANNILGATLSHLGLHEEALAAFDAAIAINGRQPHYHFNRAAELRFLGRLEEAEQACNRVIELDPENFECYLLRSDLRKQTDDNNHVVELRQALSRGETEWRSEVQLRFALAKELEDLGHYRESFEQRQAGASLRRRHTRYDVQTDIDAIDRIIEVFSEDWFAEAVPGYETDEPVFVLGLPRTGTTLLERILEGHDAVNSAGELNNFAVEMMRLVQVAQPGRALANRDELIPLTAGIDMAALGRAYLDSTRPVTGQTPHFIDKLPLNYLYAGLVHRALPGAKIIHLRRHPMAACYAIYKQLFRDAYPFSYDLDDLGRYYVAYDRLMSHWRRCLPPAAMTEVVYEDLVLHTEREARRIIEFCNLEWQPACLDIQARQTASTTASAAQVRQPVYRSSIDTWQHYHRQLEPLETILLSAGIDTSPATENPTPGTST